MVIIGTAVGNYDISDDRSKDAADFAQRGAQGDRDTAHAGVEELCRDHVVGHLSSMERCR